METKVYKVRLFINDTYEVIKTSTRLLTIDQFFAVDSDNDADVEESVFQGSLSDCEAYIRLREGGYM